MEACDLRAEKGTFGVLSCRVVYIMWTAKIPISKKRSMHGKLFQFVIQNERGNCSSEWFKFTTWTNLTLVYIVYSLSPLVFIIIIFKFCSSKQICNWVATPRLYNSQRCCLCAYISWKGNKQFTYCTVSLVQVCTVYDRLECYSCISNFWANNQNWLRLLKKIM